MNSSKQIKLGALMSYFTIAFNIIAGLIYTPWMITKIGQSNYGLYTLATSLITMFVMDFGMSAAVTRFVSKYNAEGNSQKVNDFLGVVYKMYLIIDAVILAALIVVYFLIDIIYDNLTPAEVDVFKVLYIIVGTYSLISFPFLTLNGILTAHEKFVQMKFCDLFNKVFIVILMVIALYLGYGVFALVTVNAIAGLLVIAMKLIVIRRSTPVKVNFKFFDKQQLKDIFGFSMWTTVGSLAQRLIFNITPSIIAAVSVTGSVGVAIFGLAVTIEGYIYTFATAINGMFMPRISRIIADNKKDEELLPLMIKIGRIQIALVGLVIVGFVCLGQSFIIDIWRKSDFSQSYLCAVFLIIPSFFYLPQQIANTTLVVENKVKLQAYVFLGMGAINVVLALILSKYYGALGASVSIFVAYMFRTFMMDVIYYKNMKIDIPKFFKESYLKMSPPIVASLLVGFLLEKFNPITGAWGFLINGCALVMVYCLMMWFVSFNSYEKDLLIGTAKKILKKANR